MTPGVIAPQSDSPAVLSTLGPCFVHHRVCPTWLSWVATLLLEKRVHRTPRVGRSPVHPVASAAAAADAAATVMRVHRTALDGFHGLWACLWGREGGNDGCVAVRQCNHLKLGPQDRGRAAATDSCDVGHKFGQEAYAFLVGLIPISQARDEEGKILAYSAAAAAAGSIGRDDEGNIDWSGSVWLLPCWA